jgi:23S rRNA pseudouridine1911/1915/1917 synthase
MKEFTVDSDSAGMRVDVFVASKYSQFARSALSVLFDQELVLINGASKKSGEKLRINDTVSINDTALFAEPEKIDLPIIHEDKNVVVIDKPAGILTHSKGSLNLEGTVASFIKPKINDPGLTGNRAGIVHRLDRATSGVIIAAKNNKTLSFLQKQFSQRKTKKTYIAVVEGSLEQKNAIIDAPIERNPKKPQTFRVGIGGKTAQTQYQVLSEFTRGSKTYSELELKPITGRTHQLRVHLAYIKHPIVGDRVYGTESDNMLLHAASLELTLPGGERRVFKAKVPKIFGDFINGK